MKLSKRILEIQPSATISISAKAKAMKAEGKPVLSFSVGEPDFNSPECASKAAIEAIQRGESHYTLNSGIIELRKEVCNYYKRRFGLEYAPDEVLVAPGAKPLLYEALQMFVDPGDEVLLFSPAWVSYVEQIHLAGGKEAIVDTLKTDLIPTKEAIEAVLSDKTVGMIINSPSNPTGAIYGEETLKMIADIARERDLWIIFDEIYERLAYAPANHINILSVAPDLRDKTILVNGASKAYAMTGWRIGFLCGNSTAVKAFATVKDNSDSGQFRAIQKAAINALNHPGLTQATVEKYSRRHNLLVSALNDLGFDAKKPGGTYYCYVKAPAGTRSGKTFRTAAEFSEFLITESLISTVPWDEAGKYIRFSVTFEAATPEKEAEVIGEMKRRMQLLELTF
jgi:aspartate aminotransferase